MSDFHPEAFIDQYLAGELDPDTAERVRVYLEATPGRRGFMAGLHAAARSEDLAPTLDDLAATRDELFAKLDAESAAASVARIDRFRVPSALERTLSRRWMYVGGGALALVLALAIAVGSAVVARRPYLASTRTYATNAGQCVVITLTDGSHVTLAPNSTLSVPTDFGTRSRDVELTGHAQFTVEHTSGSPFTVRTGDIATRVLGTVFDVQRYAGDPGARVAVVSGRVAVSSRTRSPVTLIAGMAGRISAAADSVMQVNTQSSDLTWTRGTLEFRDTPLPEALDALSHWYGIEFRLSDSSMARWHLNGTFAGENRAEALRTMQSALSVGMTFDSTASGRPVVTIIRRHAGQTPTSTERERLSFPHSMTEVGR